MLIPAFLQENDLAVKPENTFIASVHKYLTQTYHEKMFNPYRSGTPDVWYSGTKTDLWIEYKFIAKMPVKTDIELKLTELQKQWLKARYLEGRNVAVICGCKQGGVVFTDCLWENPIPVNNFLKQLKDRLGVAMWIHNQISKELYVNSKSNNTSVKVCKSYLQNSIYNGDDRLINKGKQS